MAPLSDLDRHACPGLRPLGRGAFFTNPLPPKGSNRRRLPGGQGQGVRHRPSSALICSTAAGPYSPGQPPGKQPPGGVELQLQRGLPLHFLHEEREDLLLLGDSTSTGGPGGGWLLRAPPARHPKHLNTLFRQVFHCDRSEKYKSNY